MPNIKSAEKRVRVSATRRARNMADRSTLRTSLKNFEKSLAEDTNTAANSFPQTMKDLDQAANKGLIHKNKAARKKARLAKKIAAGAQ